MFGNLSRIASSASSFQSDLTRRISINKNTDMNTRLHLTVLATVFAFLAPATSTLHAQVLTATDGIDVPDGTRKCIKPIERAPRPTDLLFTPLTCLEAVVNVSATTGNQAESFVNVNPTNTNNLVAFSNLAVASIFRDVFGHAGSENLADDATVVLVKW